MGFLDTFTPQELENAHGFSSFQVGDNTARIASVEETFSTNGNDMLVIHFENESGAKIRYYIVDNEWKLSKLKQLYQAFGIPFTEKNTQRWIGRMGVVVCKQGKPYNGETRPEVSYVKPPEKSRKEGPDNSGLQQPHYNDGYPRNQATEKPTTSTSLMFSTQEPPQRHNPDFDDGFTDDIPF
jgi:hypothetical protein